MAQGVIEQREQPDYDATRLRGAPRAARRQRADGPGQPAARANVEGGQVELRRRDRGHRLPRPRGLERAQILQLAESHWVEEHQVGRDRGTDRGRKDLSRLCARPRGDSSRPHGALPARSADVRRDRHRPGRRTAVAAHGRLGTHRRLVDRRLLDPAPQPDQAADLLEVIEDRVRRCARRSSRASCPSPCGTRPSGSRPSPTPCWTGCSKGPTASSSAVSHCERTNRAEAENASDQPCGQEQGGARHVDREASNHYKGRIAHLGRRHKQTIRSSTTKEVS